VIGDTFDEAGEGFGHGVADCVRFRLFDWRGRAVNPQRLGQLVGNSSADVVVMLASGFVTDLRPAQGKQERTPFQNLQLNSLVLDGHRLQSGAELPLPSQISVRQNSFYFVMRQKDR